MTIINIPKNIIKKGDLVIVEKKYLDELNKEKEELESAFKAILSGELALKQKKTRPFKDFLKAKFLEYARNK